MQLSQELPDYSYTLRAADGASARVNERALTVSFILAPDTLVEDWPVIAAARRSPQAAADHLRGFDIGRQVRIISAAPSD